MRRRILITLIGEYPRVSVTLLAIVCLEILLWVPMPWSTLIFVAMTLALRYNPSARRRRWWRRTERALGAYDFYLKHVPRELVDAEPETAHRAAMASAIRVVQPLAFVEAICMAITRRAARRRVREGMGT